MSNQYNSQASDGLIVFGAIILVLIGIYYFFGDEIRKVYLTLKLWELRLVNMVYPSETGLKLEQILINRNISNWTFDDLSQVGAYVGRKFNFIYMAIVAVVSYKIYTKNPIKSLRRIHTTETLRTSEMRLWNYISPVVGTDLVKEDAHNGPYAVSLKPYEFCMKHKLLKDNNDTSSLDEKKAEKVFTAQLGRLFTGVKDLKVHERALMAIMAAHGNGDKGNAMNAVNQIAMSVQSDPYTKPDFSSAKPLYKHLESDDVRWIFSKHAYVYTIMIELMIHARKTGVFPSSFFIWLKPRDRVLFYILNVVGRQVSFSEVAGVFAHWLMEKEAKRKVEMPYVKNAVEALKVALSEIHLNTEAIEKAKFLEAEKKREKEEKQ